MSDPFANLSDLEDFVWHRLAQGVADAQDPFRLVTLATCGARGAEARSVGLRRADRVLAEVEVHSDLRTAKVAAIHEDPRAELLFWDAPGQVQLRLSVTMRLVPSDAARWARVPSQARLNYGTDPAPGTPIKAPEVLTRTAAVDRFGALVGRVTRIDVLSLAHDPHRRAIFETGGGTWVAP